MNEPDIDKKIIKVKPALVPVKCVLCEGFGSFSHGRVICNGCHGKGYILVPAKEVEEKNEN